LYRKKVVHFSPGTYDPEPPGAAARQFSKSIFIILSNNKRPQALRKSLAASAILAYE